MWRPCIPPSDEGLYDVSASLHRMKVYHAFLGSLFLRLIFQREFNSCRGAFWPQPATGQPALTTRPGRRAAPICMGCRDTVVEANRQLGCCSKGWLRGCGCSWQPQSVCQALRVPCTCAARQPQASTVGDAWKPDTIARRAPSSQPSRLHTATTECPESPESLLRKL